MGELGGPLLLTDPSQLSSATQAYLSANKATIPITGVYIFGGTAAITPTVRNEIAAAL